MSEFMLEKEEDKFLTSVYSEQSKQSVDEEDAFKRFSVGTDLFNGLLIVGGFLIEFEGALKILPWRHDFHKRLF